MNSVINGLYLPTQETGQDGRRLYRKSGECGDQALCIEHVEDCWEVTDKSHNDSGVCCAYVLGDCALEDCCSRPWRVYDGENHVDQPSVKVFTGDEANSMVSGHSTLALICGPFLPYILSLV